MRIFEQVVSLGLPCYLSFEWSMFYHGLIDQPVHTIQCATLQDGFRIRLEGLSVEYICLPEDYYFGSVTVEDPYSGEEYPIATPEKSLLDYLWKQRDLGYSPDLLFFADWDRVNLQTLFNLGQRMEPWLSVDMATFVGVRSEAFP